MFSLRGLPIATAAGGSGFAVITFSQSLWPGTGAYLVVILDHGATGVITSSLSLGGYGAFAKAAAVNSATRSMEIFVGYGFPPYQGTVLNLTGTKSVSTTTGILARVIDISGTPTAPVFQVSTPQTGTGVTADSGLLTPAVGDLVVAACVTAGTAASTARTHTGNAYVWPDSASSGVARGEYGMVEATAAVPSKEQWTFASIEWAAVQASWTPGPPPAPGNSHLLKGLTTETADLASSY